MRDEADADRHPVLRRMRWRLRGASQWPVFLVVTLLEATLLRWLPLAGDGTGWIPALLLAGCLNLIAVAVLGGLVGLVLRRRRPDLPKEIADDYAGTALVLALAVVLVGIGLAHRPAVLAARDAFAAQSDAVRRWVEAEADPVHRANIDAADTLRLEDDLYRTCIPGPDPKRWLCVVVDTTHSPPKVRRDPNNESNTSLNRPGAFR